METIAADALSEHRSAQEQRGPASRRGLRRARWVILALLLGIGAPGAYLAWRELAPPKRFSAVVPGQLYRSGEVNPAQLVRLQRQYGLRRVISLLNPAAPESVAERAAAERLGLAWENVPLTGDGASTPEDRRRLLALLEDTAAGPTLVHCAAGVNRTGLAVGLYRLHVEGWPLERVMAELRRNSFRDLPKHENLRAALRDEAERAALSRAAQHRAADFPAADAAAAR